MIRGDVYMRALADAGAVGLGDLTPAEEAAVRDQARATFAAQVPPASTAAVSAVTRAVAGAKKKATAAVKAIVPTAAGKKGSFFSSDTAWLGLAGVVILGGAIAWKYYKPRPTRRNHGRGDEMRRTQELPAMSMAELVTGKGTSAKSRKFFESFHWGRKPKRSKRVEVPRTPRELVELGKLRSVTYTAKKGKDPVADYVHDFEAPHPTLAADPKNRRLHVVGGGYDIEERGIVG